MATEQVELKVGLTVRLKAGGPLMTIESVYKKGDFAWYFPFKSRSVLCAWFEHGSVLKRDWFDPVTLKAQL